MDMKDTMNKNQALRILGISFCFIALLAPIIIYVSQFGIGVWDDHSKWAEMGAAFSGIYSPLIAFLAFLILTGQVRSQFLMNKHTLDQSYIKDAREDLDFYIARLERLLDESGYPETSARDALRTFSLMHEDDLRSERCLIIANQLRMKHQKVFDTWIAIYPLLRGLGVNNHHPYVLSYSGSILRVSTVLSMESCVALDKLYYSSIFKMQKEQLIFWKDS